MINLLNETLIHPHINTKWTVIGFNNDMLECVSEDSVEVEFITKEYGLEMYAEQQKKRADELEDMLNKEVEESYQMENRWRTEIERADELEKEKNDAVLALFNQKDYYGKFVSEQKQRADRAEKRWEKLKEHFNKEKEQSFGILSWSRNDGMLELMEQLEEDGE